MARPGPKADHDLTRHHATSPALVSGLSGVKKIAGNLALMRTGVLWTIFPAQQVAGLANIVDITESGLPLSDEARAEVASFKTPDKAVTAGEISRVKPPPALAKKAPPPPRNTVEVIQGNKIEKVDQ